jgi:hypothetical protein
LALDGHGWDFHRDTGLQGGCPGGVGLIRTLAAISQDDVIQLVTGNIGPFQDFSDDRGGQLVGPQRFKGLAELSYGGAGGTYNNNIIWTFQNSALLYIVKNVIEFRLSK